MTDPHHPEFWVMIAFILFVVIIIYYRVPGLIGAALDARADAIRKELDEARRLREAAARLLADYQRRSREVDDEARLIIESARHEAEIMAAETRRALAEQLERRTKLAQEKIARAEALAMNELRAVAVDKAIEAAEAILKARVTDETAGALADQAIRDLRGQLN